MPINFLDLTGPSFLIFYLAVGLMTLFLVRILYKQRETQWQVPKLDLTDPYEIAYLRAGENEALRIATLSLIDRGLLEVEGDALKAHGTTAADHARRPIEKAILRKFGTAQAAAEMFTDVAAKSACDEYHNSLGSLRLVTTDDVLAARRPVFLIALLILLGLAGLKIAIALSRGHHNILFLVGLAILFPYFLFKTFKRDRTYLGDRVLRDLRSLFKGLKDRGSLIRAGGETNEAALLVAVFGISVLSASRFPYLRKLYPKASKLNINCSASACGATWRTSCGSSCGSSCGGGGCGGGCGGCGS